MSPSLQDEYIKKESLHGAQNYSPLSVVLERGEGAYLWDVDGNKYLDNKYDHCCMLKNQFSCIGGKYCTQTYQMKAVCVDATSCL